MRSRFRRSEALGLVFAVGACGLAILLRVLANLAPGEYPFTTFYGAVFATALLAGTRPAVFCTVLTTILAWYYFVPPAYIFAAEYSAVVGILFFVAISGLIIYILDALTRTAEKLAAEQQVSLALIEQQRTMFAELQHRVANNLAFLTSLLHLQRKQVLADPSSATDLLDEVIRRLEVMGRLHRRLHDPALADQPVGDYLGEICTDVLEATGARNIVCMIDCDDIRLDLTKLTALSLLITELMTNSVKHAFRDRTGGTINVNLKRLPSGLINVDIADDGPGLPHALSAVSTGGLGLRIIRGLAAQLGAELHLPSPGSSTTRLVFAP